MVDVVYNDCDAPFDSKIGKQCCGVKCKAYNKITGLCDLRLTPSVLTANDAPIEAIDEVMSVIVQLKDEFKPLVESGENIITNDMFEVTDRLRCGRCGKFKSDVYNNVSVSKEF